MFFLPMMNWIALWRNKRTENDESEKVVKKGTAVKMAGRSKHPYEAFIPENAEKLILGTIPPYRFCHPDEEKLFAKDVDFYYGSKDNYFWKLLSGVLNRKLSYANSERAIEERKQLLTDIHAGIADMVESCVHIDKRSDDASLDDIRQRDLPKLLLQNPNIKELIYTSRFVAKLVGQSVSRFHNIQVRHRWAADKLDGSIEIGGKRYEVHILYSPSPNALRSISPGKRLERYRKIFAEHSCSHVSFPV